MTTKTKIILVLNFVAIGIGAFFLLQQLFFEEEPNMSLISKAAILFVTYTFGVSRFFYQQYKAKRERTLHKYSFFFADTFINDKKNSSLLYAITTCFEKENFNKAYDMIETLKKNCYSASTTCSVLLLEVLCLNGKQNYSAALSTAEKAIELAPDNANAWALSALLQHRLGFSAQGLSHAKHAVELAPNNPIVHTYKSLLHLRREEYEMAHAHATAAIHFDPTEELSCLLFVKAYCGQKGIEPTSKDLKNIKKRGNSVYKSEKELNTLLS